MQELKVNIATKQYPLTEARVGDTIVYLTEVGAVKKLDVDSIDQGVHNISEKFGRIFFDKQGNYITEKTGDIFRKHIHDRQGFALRFVVNK